MATYDEQTISFHFFKRQGYSDAFDCVYGSSAGAIVGAYFVSRQLPLYGARVYFEDIPSDKFISIWALRSHPYFRPFNNRNKLYYTQTARPVLHLDALLETIILKRRPLHYQRFSNGNKHQPLFPIASCLTSMTSKALSHESLPTLIDALRASARVPGIAGPAVLIDGKPYSDAWMLEPIPYQTALADGCTHVLVLRSRAGGGGDTQVGVYERHIAAPYFNMDKHTASTGAAEYVLNGGHINAYEDAVDELEKGRSEQIGSSRGSGWVLEVVPRLDAREVGQLETRGSVLNEGCRVGFSAAYEMLSPFCVEAEGRSEEEKWISVVNGMEVKSVTERRKKAKGRRRIRRMSLGDKVARWVFRDTDVGNRVRGRVKKGVEKVNFGEWNYGGSTEAAEAKKRARAEAKKRLRRMKVAQNEKSMTVEERFFLG